MDYLYNRRILGDATFVNSAWPWFSRGGGYNYGIGAGVFDFVRTNGAAGSGGGFRVVLVV